MLFTPLVCFSTTLQSEIDAAISFLEKLPEKDRIYTRFFTLYAVPEELKEDCTLTLSFICHSLGGLSSNPLENTANIYPLAKLEEGEFKPITNVPGTDLYFFDLRWFNWEPEDWEYVATLEGYTVEPIIQHKDNTKLRLLSGNSLIRGDWFIVHAFDQCKQADIDIDPTIYESLLYSKQEKIPKTIQEFEKIWGVNTEESRQLASEHGALVIDSTIVARHNRMLLGYRTPIGYYYSTRDVKAEQGQEDLLELIPESKGFPPRQGEFAAGESIVSNQFGLNVYALFDGATGNLIDFADPTVARNMSDIVGDSRVRVGISCSLCHYEGLNEANNVLTDFKDYLNIITPYYEDKARIENVFQNGRFNEELKDNKNIFSRALLKINGLTPDQNLTTLTRIWRWYHKPLSLEQMLIECSTTEEILRNKVENSHEVFFNNRVPGRLKLALNKERPIPISREAWESNNKGRPGIYQQTMLTIHGLTQISKEYVENPLPKEHPTTTLDIEIDEENVEIAERAIEAKVGSKVVHIYQPGDRIDLTGKEQIFGGVRWLQVKDKDDNIAFVKESDLK